MRKRATKQTYDYHGAGIDAALARFAADYFDEFDSEGMPGWYRVIHGYGSHDTKHIICDAIRAILAFQKESGVLDFVPGEEIDGNPGWTSVLPKTQLQELRVAVIRPFLSAERTELAVRAFNDSLLRRPMNRAKKTILSGVG
jgi:hypothetical protein